MCSGQNAYQKCEVWGRLDIPCLSYLNFLFHGETSKFVRPPRTCPSTKMQFNVAKALRLHSPNLKMIRLKLQEEFVKVRGLKMAKTAQKSERKFKMADFLLCLGLRSKRPFCRYQVLACMYRISYTYVEHSGRRTPLNFYRWRYRAILPRPILKPISDVNFRQF